MDATPTELNQFPKDLIDWAGHHSGGVKRLFDENSGRPGKALLRTNLLSKLEAWTRQVSSGTPGTPRVLLLVGGPGNGKTEAIESTARWLDNGLACSGRLIQALSSAFHPPIGHPVPRIVHVDVGSIAALGRPLQLDIVQDASVDEELAAPVLLIEELRALLAGPSSRLYLCCVNRGVLDDALIHAIENHHEEARDLLEAITRSVSLASNAQSCWPLQGFPDVAVWPMDAESLLVSPDGESPSPGKALLKYATDPASWPAPEQCQAAERCPFCSSQAILARDEPRDALLKILRWYELASGKRWSFRDLFSLTSYLLAGHRTAGQGEQDDPCKWAAHLIELDKSAFASKRPKATALTAIFHLVASSYQHALFHRWDKDVVTALRQDMKDLGIGKDSDEYREEFHTLIGLCYFIQERKLPHLPATIAPLLEGVVDLLDPALSSSDAEVAVSSRSKVLLGEIDVRFSRSLGGGIDHLRKYQVLSQNETELLKRLAKIDVLLVTPAIRRKRPTAASRIQRLLRDFACRLVRRSICVRSSIVADAEILHAFQQVVEDDARGQRLNEVARQVRNLLNSQSDFEVSLTTTFGQPLPPMQRRATLAVDIQRVRMLQTNTVGRPRHPICFLEVGAGQSAQPIPLTYDLFKAVRELERGLSAASLPRTVVALLDTTRARLAGQIVRDNDVLSDAKIRLGADGAGVARSWGDEFISSNEGEQR